MKREGMEERVGGRAGTRSREGLAPLPGRARNSENHEKGVDISREFVYNRYCDSVRGISAVGSAFEWHSKGQGFDSPMLHQILEAMVSGIIFLSIPRRMKKAAIP